MGRFARGTLTLLVAGAAVVVVRNVTADPLADTHRIELQRAVATYSAMLATYRRRDGFAERAGADDPGRPTAHAWPVSQVVAASIAMAAIPHASASYRADVPAALAALDAYWSPEIPGVPGGYASAPAAPPGPGGAQFYDDNEWIALDLLAAYRLRRDPDLLARARSIFTLVASGWTAQANPCPGGVYWERSAENRDRSAVSTENGAILGLELHELTGVLSYLTWAKRMFDWSQRCLLRQDGLLADHVAADGTRDERAWSYNQGAFIAAAVLLAHARNDGRYLDRAQKVASAALAAYGRHSFSGEPRVFVAILFRDFSRCSISSARTRATGPHSPGTPSGPGRPGATRGRGCSREAGRSRRCSTRRRWSRSTRNSRPRACASRF